MLTAEQMLTSAEAADLCSVPRSTLSYWIKTKKLRADRSGKNYLVPVGDLLYFLKATGRDIPREIVGEGLGSPVFKSTRSCWDYLGEDRSEHYCGNCVVFRNKLEVCFTARGSSQLNCKTSCGDCKHYMDTYFPRIQFAHQFETPAAVYKGQHLWGGNNPFAELCGIGEKVLPGTSIEQIFHPDSLQTVISNMRKIALGDPDVSRTYNVVLNQPQGGKLEMRISVHSLNEPLGTFFVFFEPIED